MDAMIVKRLIKKLLNKRLITIPVIMATVIFISSSIRGVESDGNQVAVVKREDLSEVIIVDGTVVGKNISPIYSPINGTIEEIYVKEGDKVAKNQPLLKIKNISSEDEKARARKAYGNLNQGMSFIQANQQQLMSLRSQLNYHDLDVEENGDGNLRESIDRTITQYNRLYSEIQSQQKVAWSYYQGTQDIVIKSSFAGTVTDLSFNNGDFVFTTDNSFLVEKMSSGNVRNDLIYQKMPPILTIHNFEEKHIQVQIDENKKNKIRPDGAVKIKLSDGNQSIEGKIVHVASEGFLYQGEVYYNVMIASEELANTIPLSNAVVFIETFNAENIITIPNNAITYYQGNPAVWLTSSKNLPPSIVPIEIGIRGIDKSQILNGLEEGSVVTIMK